MLIGELLARADRRRARGERWQQFRRDPAVWCALVIVVALAAIIAGAFLARMMS